MSTIPKGGKARELPTEDSHFANCVQVIDLGTQDGGQWGPKRKVQLAFEIADEETSDGGALVVYRQYTFTDSQKGALMRDLKAWLKLSSGEGFDMEDCLGKPALIGVEHNETDKGTFANVTSVSAVPKGSKVRKPTEEIKSLFLDDNFDREVFESLPEFLQNKIADSPEYEEYGVDAKPKAKAKPAKKAAAKRKK